MNKATILGLLFVLVAVSMIVQSSADIPSPLAQYNSGIPIQDMQCRDSMILMEKPSGAPACANSVERLQQMGWTVVDKQDAYRVSQDSADDVSSKRIIVYSDDLPPSPEPKPYGAMPTVVFDYPEQVSIGKVNTIRMNYTFADLDNIDDIPNPFDSFVTMTYETGVEVLNDDMRILNGSIIAKGYPDLEFRKYSANRTFQIDPSGQHQYEIQFKVTEPPKPRSGLFAINLHFAALDKWLHHNNGTITIGDPPPPPKGASGSIENRLADDPYVGKAIEIPDDPDNPTMPPIDGFAELLRKYILPTTPNLRQYLIDADMPTDYIDELFTKYPDLDTQNTYVGFIT